MCSKMLDVERSKQDVLSLGMQSLEFRVWDRNRGRMIYFGDPNYAIELRLDGSLRVTELFDDRASLGDAGAYVLLRYTILHDVAGEKIFEGDIIQHIEVGHVGVVEQFDYQWALRRGDGYTELFLDYHGESWDGSRWKRIGTLYENADLLAD